MALAASFSCRPVPAEVYFLHPRPVACRNRWLNPGIKHSVPLLCHPQSVGGIGFGQSTDASKWSIEKPATSTILNEVEEWQGATKLSDSGVEDNDSPSGQEVTKASITRFLGGLDYDNLLTKILQMFPYELDLFQKKAIRVILSGKSVVVCAPTGAGKTAIAEAAAVLGMETKGKIIYTTPLKALSNQKVFEFQERFGRGKVGLVTGDASYQPEAPLVVMTTEILRNIMYSDDYDTRGRLDGVKAIVLDEVHYLGDPDRGTVWEEVIAGCPENIQMICMSATVSNPVDLGAWISAIHGPCKTIRTMERPVPLEWHFAYSLRKKAEIDALFKEGNKMNPKIAPRIKRNGEPLKIVPSMTDLVEALDKQDFLPAIVFTFSRRQCDQYVGELATGGFSFTSKYEREIIQSSVDNMKREQPEAVRYKLVHALLSGIASHHAGCLPGWKSLVETLFQNGLIRIVFATETLAAGINMPARTTVLMSISKRVDEGRLILTHNQILQMAGRAGRRGYDVIGNCIICQSRFDMPQEAVEQINCGPEPLISQFKSGYSLVLNLLSKYSLEEAKDFVSRSFRNYMAKIEENQYEKEIKQTLNKASPMRLHANKLEDEKKTLMKSVDARRQELKLEIRSLTETLEMKIDERTSYIKSILGKEDSLPVIIQLTTSGNAQQRGNRTPMLALAFAVIEGASDDRDQVVCLGIEGSLYQANIQNVLTVYDYNVDSEDFIFRLQERRSQVDNKNKWTSISDTTRVARGNVHLSGIAFQVLRKTSKKKALKQLPDCELLWDEIKACMEECSKLEADFDEFQKEKKSIRRRAKDSQKRLNNMEQRLEMLEKMKNRVSTVRNSNWMDFQGTMAVLIAAGALDPENHTILPLGRVAQELHGDNELWLALALSHPRTSLLNTEDLAGFAASLVAAGCATKPEISASYPASDKVLEMVEEMESIVDELLCWEMEHTYPSEIIIDPRLSGVVSAWAQGCTWAQIMQGTSLEDGDLCRLLARTVDLLHQVATSSQLMGPLKSTARKAYQAMNRRPVKEVIM